MDNTQNNNDTIYKRTKRKKAIIISAILGVLVLILFFAFFFISYKVPYDHMYGGIQAVERDGIIEFDFYLTNSGDINFTGGISSTVIYDYDYGIKYVYQFMQIKTQRWHVWFKKDVLTSPGFSLTKDGIETHSGADREFDPNIDYRENPLLMRTRRLRVYYSNPDGSVVLIWEHPDAKEIEERCGAALQEPQYYRSNHNK